MRSLKNVDKTWLSSLLHQHVWYVPATNLSLTEIHILQVLKDLIILSVVMQVIRVLTPIYSNLLPFGPLPWRLFWIIIWSSLTYIMLTICKMLVGVSLRQLATRYLAQRQEEKQHIDWNQNFAFFLTLSSCRKSCLEIVLNIRFLPTLHGACIPLPDKLAACNLSARGEFQMLEIHQQLSSNI